MAPGQGQGLGFHHAGRGGEVGLAYLQVDDVAPLGFQLLGPLQYFHNDEGADVLGSVGWHGYGREDSRRTRDWASRAIGLLPARLTTLLYISEASL